MFKHSRMLALAIATLCTASFPRLINAQTWSCSSSPCWTNYTVGIGIPFPAYTLDVNGTIGIDSSWARFFLRTSGTGAAVTFSQDGSGNGILDAPTGAGQIILSTQGTGRVNVLQNGNIGIGTNNPQQLLDVAGTMAAREVIVTQTGADYVFAPDYRLVPLTEVAGFINEHHHLPDIPSEKEMKEKGVGVADMQAKLLAKIEELTLHMIQAEDRNSRLEHENRELAERLTRLESRGVRK